MKDYIKQIDLEKIYESNIRNTGQMSAPDAGKITPGNAIVTGKQIGRAHV